VRSPERNFVIVGIKYSHQHVFKFGFLLARRCPVKEVASQLPATNVFEAIKPPPVVVIRIY
jgi:hypothetical protein